MIHVGIDLGKSAIAVCPTADDSPRRWKVTKISLSDPDWHIHLRALVPAGATVAIEPTGTHYMTPIITALQPRNCTIWQIPTTATSKIRAIHISQAKSDRTDAQALALAARWLAAGDHIPGAYPYDTDLEEEVTHLRALVNTHERLTKSRTRALNQLDALAHSMWPSLAQKKSTWLRAAHAGYITPAEIHDLARALARQETIEGYSHNSSREALFRLAKITPALDARPATRAAIADLLAMHATLNDQIHANAQAITAAVLRPPFEDITRRWMTVPYAVPESGELPGNLITLAALHVATHGRADAIPRDTFKAAIGAHPKTRQSGDRITRDIKKGYRPAMRGTRLWAMRLLNPQTIPNPVRDYHQRVKTPYKTQAAVGKLAVILWAVARDPEGYRYPAP